jgi:hypothetical protein
MRFIVEEQTEAYRRYVEGVPQAKIKLWTKSSRGATCSAGRQAGAVRGSE